MACGSNDVELVKDKIHALLGTHLATLFLQNKLSAHETQHLATMAHLAGVLLAQKLHEAYGTLHTSLVLQLAQVLMKIYQCMDECWDNDMASKLSMMMGCIYVKLSDEADMEGTNTWRIKPKLHMFLELLECQSKEFVNPRGFLGIHG